MEGKIVSLKGSVRLTKKAKKCEVCNLGIVVNLTCTHCKIKYCSKCSKPNDSSKSLKCHCSPSVQWISDETEPE